MGIALGLLALAAAGVLVAVVRWRARDEVFEGITPGLFPAPGQPVLRRRVARSAQPPIAVRFTPPDGVSPGLAGTVVDNTVNPVDVSATLIDLAVRGWFTIRPLGHDQQPSAVEKPRRATKRDWELARTAQAPQEELAPAEALLLRGLFGTGSVTTLAQLRARHADVLREATVELYRESVRRRWFAEHPRRRPKGWLALGIVLVLTGLAAALGPLLVGLVELAFFGLGLAAAGILVAVGTWVSVPTTAEGSAVRVQALGFREYLATAEAGQLAVDAAADVYSRYLPYAMVFGVVDHWNRVFAGVIDRAHAEGIPFPIDLGWLVGGLDLVDLDGLWDLGDGAADGLVDLLDGFTDGAGDFAESVGDTLSGLGDGCDLLDGCGCDF